MLPPLMKASGFLQPVLTSLVATPICLLLAISSAAAGHGSYFLAKLLFPFTMLSTIVFGSIAVPFILLAIIQFPFYGIFLGVGNVRGRFIPLAVGVLVAHTLAVGASVLFIKESFS